MQTLDKKFMRQALSLAEGALSAGEFPVGCVFVYENRVVARASRTGSGGTAVNEIDHAEILALREYYRLPAGCDPEKTTVYCTLEPCLMCFGALVIAGIGRIVYAYEDAMGGGTRCQLVHLPPMYRERRPEVVPNVLRAESLELFQAFFNKADATYLKGTYLASYTLGQIVAAPSSPARGIKF